MNRLTVLVEDDELAPVDAEFGALLTRRSIALQGSPGDALAVGLAGALVSAERGQGHSCLELDALASRAGPLSERAGSEVNGVERWRASLAQSAMCGDGSAPHPLVLDGSRLYLYRYYAAESRLAAALRARLEANGPDEAPARATVDLFRRLFTASTDAPTDWQAVAAAAALRGSLTIITGGPGTGKTTTVARILALLLHRDPKLRIALAAPTGKAAARLGEAISTVTASLGIDESLRARIPTAGRTLHRLLGYRPDTDTFARGPSDQLAEDVVIVDEASMVDVLMMDALFAALRTSTHVILLGDQDQLASVDTGNVLSEICGAADADGPGHGAELASWYGALSGKRLEPAASASPIRDAVVRLIHSYRFDAQPGIGALASAVRSGSGEATYAALANYSRSDVRLHEPTSDDAKLLAPISESIDHYLAARTPDEALDRLGAFRVLCAVREGPVGVAGLNERIEHWLRGRGVRVTERWYHCKPVLVTANDPATGLYNGDVGVTLVESKHPRVWFRDSQGAPRSIAPARLPAHDTAWAMTVHKAQGSEFSRVLFVLPDRNAQVLTRELLYTAVTRARERVDIFGSTSVLDYAIAHTVRRISGLADRLRA